MRINDTYDAFEQTYSYPVDRETVIETMGDRTVESPHGTNETIAEILTRAETETYETSRDLCDVFAGHLSDQYIGRKFYDDRGDNVGTTPNTRT
ncbi:hypothetical protein BRC92_04645 [Halobacteriales archaeon QS_4_69_31]|jgi:hypothetical protein|nr:MAG: hypothetical protein BRC92_04645 [Halobacteriales archaeon QS_4_69_31]